MRVRLDIASIWTVLLRGDIQPGRFHFSLDLVPFTEVILKRKCKKWEDFRKDLHMKHKELKLSTLFNTHYKKKNYWSEFKQRQ